MAGKELLLNSVVFLLGMPFLLRLVHGNSSSLTKMSVSFQRFWVDYIKQNNMKVRSLVSKRQLEKKIQSISSRSMNNELGKICYTVKDDVLTAYELADLKLGTGLPRLEENCVGVKSTADTNNESSVPATITKQPVTSNNNGTVENGLPLEVEKSKQTEPMIID